MNNHALPVLSTILAGRIAPATLQALYQMTAPFNDLDLQLCSGSGLQARAELLCAMPWKTGAPRSGLRFDIKPRQVFL